MEKQAIAQRVRERKKNINKHTGQYIHCIPLSNKNRYSAPVAYKRPDYIRVNKNHAHGLQPRVWARETDKTSLTPPPSPVCHHTPQLPSPPPSSLPSLCPHLISQSHSSALTTFHPLIRNSPSPIVPITISQPLPPHCNPLSPILSSCTPSPPSRISLPQTDD